MQWYWQLLHDPFRLLLLLLWFGLLGVGIYKKNPRWVSLITCVSVYDIYGFYSIAIASDNFLEFLRQENAGIGHSSEFGFAVISQMALLDLIINIIFLFGFIILIAHFRLKRSQL